MLQKIIFAVLLFVKIDEISCAARDRINRKPLNIAVIGAGAAGLVSTKYSISYGHNVTVYDQQEEIGGVWIYTDQIGKDKYGVDIHTPMYTGLRTNSPYQMMEFLNHPYPNGTQSFPPQKDVLKYLRSYADRNDLNKYIKLSHLVVRVDPIENDKWKVTVRDLPNNKVITEIYDAVFVCNGHYFAPKYPRIDGAREFKGRLMHSRDYRKASAFRGEKVLVIGAGLSGRDIALHISTAAKRVMVSRNKHNNDTRQACERTPNSFPPNIEIKDNVKRFTPSGAEFIDGSKEKFDSIVYATGYKYSYPFLSDASGIRVENNFVQPLYKQIFNIEHPSMAFVGIPSTFINFPFFDLQVRFAIKFLSGEKILPTKTDMLRDWSAETQSVWNKGYSKAKTHYLIPIELEYQKQLSDLAGIKNLPHLFYSIPIDVCETSHVMLTEYRKFKYTIIDDKSFTKEKYET